MKPLATCLIQVFVVLVGLARGSDSFSTEAWEGDSAPHHEVHCLLQSKVGLDQDTVGHPHLDMLDTVIKPIEDEELYGRIHNLRMAALKGHVPVQLVQAQPAPAAQWEFWAKIVYGVVLFLAAFSGLSGMYSILKYVVKTAFWPVHSVEEPETKEPTPYMGWEHAYQPVWLVARGLIISGKQAFVLSFVYYQICMWNPNKLKIVLHCNAAHLGHWSFFCEGTLAFARSVPLLGATFSMVITSRFIAQQRLYYLLLKSGILIDYANYTFVADGAVLTVMVCFSIGLMHWIEGLSYMSLEKMMFVVTSYVVPVGVFFVLLESVFDIERHLVPLAKFYEEDPMWARGQLAQSVMVSEKAVRHCARQAQIEMRREYPDGFSMNQLLEKVSMKARAVADAGEDEEDELDGSRITNALFRGLWPTSFVLDRRLNDKTSALFRKAVVCFFVIFTLTQVAVIGMLVASAWQAFSESLPSSKPYGAQLYGNSYYDVFGDGYCRGPTTSRPPGMYRSLLEVDRTACGEQCSELDTCLAFSVDLDLCILYLPEMPERPLPGWTLMTNVAESVRGIVGTNEAKEVMCFARIADYAETEDLMGSFVYFGHLLVVAWVLREASILAFGHKPHMRLHLDGTTPTHAADYLSEVSRVASFNLR
mmetsp:Transcript_26610/g.61146  ORF Transcript_26610/g.61146 Transcript_26610/m.61146 type:complete len:647 (+) Transcript_26610:72-2012(+)